MGRAPVTWHRPLAQPTPCSAAGQGARSPRKPGSRRPPPAQRLSCLWRTAARPPAESREASPSDPPALQSRGHALPGAGRAGPASTTSGRWVTQARGHQTGTSEGSFPPQEGEAVSAVVEKKAGSTGREAREQGGSQGGLWTPLRAQPSPAQLGPQDMLRTRHGPDPALREPGWDQRLGRPRYAAWRPDLEA